MRTMPGVHTQQAPSGLDIDETGLIAFWRLNEGTGTNAASTTGDHAGTLVGTPTWVAGKSGTGVSLNGTSQYIDVTTTAALVRSGGTTLTIMAWINAASTTGVRRIMAHPTSQTDGSERYALYINAGQMIFQIGWNGGDAGTQVAYTTTGSWTHVCGIYNGANIRLYLNGAAVGTATTVSTAFDAAANGNFQIGRFGPTWGQYFSGTVDDVRIYSRAISAAEVTQVYDLG